MGSPAGRATAPSRTLRAVGGDAAFGAMLRGYRRAAGLSQEELAARAFVSTRAISDLERGVNARPRMHTALALADGLGLVGDERVAFVGQARPADNEAAADALVVPARARPPLTVDRFVDDGCSLNELLKLVDDASTRLVTLTGPGGIGKTRLAVELAHQLEGPVAFVPLASLVDPALLAATVGQALAVEHGPTRTHLESLIEHVGARTLTIVLDNLEQIPDAAGDIATLLRSCPALTVVATSRVPLRIAGEHRFAVRPLDVASDDPAARPSVQLFLDRAAAVGAGSRSDPADLDAVAELCARLDGVPLAIELAAARSRIVAPAEMLRHLDQVLDLLSSGRSDTPAQHQSMRAALEWSYRLLPPEAEEAFMALGVFAAEASSDAAMTVWGLPSDSAPAFFDIVETLADAHLISAEPSGDGGIRIGMFETTCQFARQKLEETDGGVLARRRLAQWATDLVATAEPALIGPDQGPWLDRLDTELANLRTVARWLGEQEGEDATESALQLAGGLARFWDIRSRWSEGVAWLRDALGRPGGPSAVRAKAHKALGVMHRCLGELDEAEAELAQAVDLYGDAADALGVASCLNNRGVVALDRAEYERAAALFRQALEVCEAHGDEQLQPLVLNNLGLTTIEIGELREALRLCRRSRRLLAAHGNVAMLSWPDDNLATVLTMAGHPHWAVPIHERVIRHRLGFGDESGFTWSLEALAAAWTATGETERAGQALGFVAAHRRRLGAVTVPHLTALTARRSDALIARIGADRFAELWDEGAEMGLQVVRGWFAG